MRRWAFFYQEVEQHLPREPQPVCGSEGVMQLDRRQSTLNQERAAIEYGQRRKYHGFRIEEGESLLRTRPVGRYVPIAQAVPFAKRELDRLNWQHPQTKPVRVIFHDWNGTNTVHMNVTPECAHEIIAKLREVYPELK